MHACVLLRDGVLVHADASAMMHAGALMHADAGMMHAGFDACWCNGSC